MKHYYYLKDGEFVISKNEPKGFNSKVLDDSHESHAVDLFFASAWEQNTESGQEQPVYRINMRKARDFARKAIQSAANDKAGIGTGEDGENEERDLSTKSMRWLLQAHIDPSLDTARTSVDLSHAMHDILNQIASCQS